MKRITLVLLAVTVCTLTVRADDFHLVQTAVFDEALLPPGAEATNAIYVLLLPLHNGTQVHINPVVMKKFDGREIGKIIEEAVALGFLPSGGILHFDPSPVMKRPPDVEVKALTDYCKKIGITVLVSSTT